MSQPPNPKATVGVLRRVEGRPDIEVLLADLLRRPRVEQAVTEMTAEDEEIAEYVAALEERGDAEVDVNEASKVGDAGRRVRALPGRRGPGFRAESADHGAVATAQPPGMAAGIVAAHQRPILSPIRRNFRLSDPM